MITFPIKLSRIVQIVAVVATIFILPQIAFTQCLAIPESGRWRNLDRSGQPSHIDVKMISCGDQALNGVPTETRYNMRVWVRRDDGTFYGRDPVQVFFSPWNGRRWVRGNVTTGGYQDQMWMRVERVRMRPRLHVYIVHKSLDIKPDAQSEYWYEFVKRI